MDSEQDKFSKMGTNNIRLYQMTDSMQANYNTLLVKDFKPDMVVSPIVRARAGGNEQATDIPFLDLQSLKKDDWHIILDNGDIPNIDATWSKLSSYIRAMAYNIIQETKPKRGVPTKNIRKKCHQY